MKKPIGDEEFERRLQEALSKDAWIWTVHIWRGPGTAIETRGWANELDARICAMGWIMRGARQVEVYKAEAPS